MPDLIRHPEHTEITGFRPSRLCHNTSNPSFRTSSPEVNEIRNPEYTKEINAFWIPARARFAGLGRNDELRHSLLRRNDTLKKFQTFYEFIKFDDFNLLTIKLPLACQI